MTESKLVSIETIDGVHVTVPDSLQFMTTFVLCEQRDWFEDETAFVRRYLKPGMTVIDMGANCGVYTLLAASLVGSTGIVWAFEPTKTTAACLERSIAANGFRNTRLLDGRLLRQAVVFPRFIGN